jgi:hypothetical protein
MSNNCWKENKMNLIHDIGTALLALIACAACILAWYEQQKARIYEQYWQLERECRRES